jgi:hypothetical protein
MEQAVQMETTLFGGPPELGNMLKLANGQIGFMTIFAHPLFSNVADIIPAMRFAADEILTNKGVWFTRAEHEKKLQLVKKGTGAGDGGAISPRTQSPVGRLPEPGKDRQLPVSPLREMAESDAEAKAGRGRQNANNGPQNGSGSSSLDAVAAIVVPHLDSSAHEVSETSSGRGLKAVDRDRSGSALVNGEHIPKELTLDHAPIEEMDGHTSNSTPRQGPSLRDMSSESSMAQNDTRRDQVVSMRAGAAAIPPEALEQSKVSDAEALQKFNFATSNEDEPVREFDPNKDYQPSHPGTRASAPATDIGTPAKDLHGTKQKISEENENPSETKLRGGGGEDMLTPSGSATSYASDKSETTSRHQNSFQAVRNRAASAPMHSGSPVLRPSFSMGSNSTTSREGSKFDVHTTIFSNGVGEQGSAAGRKASTKTVGRRRSKLKMGLAFWKRNRSDKSIEGDAERPTSEGSSGGC